MTSAYLVDKSAVEWARVPRLGERLSLLLAANRIYTSGMVDLEILYSARSRREFEDLLTFRRGLPRAPTTPAVMDRAIDIQYALAKKGQHRCPIPDLVIAATAAEADLTVLHYDADFERIAEAAGIRQEWVVERGSVD